MLKAGLAQRGKTVDGNESLANPGVIGLPVASIQWQFFAVCTGFPGCQAPHLEFAPGMVRLATQRPPDTLSEVFSQEPSGHHGKS